MARITPLHLIPALIAAASHASEITIEKQPFCIEKSLNATALPAGDAVLIVLKTKAWSSFEVQKITPHGTKVAKGDVLISFDPKDIDQKIDDARRSLKNSKLTLDQAELDQKTLELTAPNKLESLSRAAEIAAEENAYFTKVRRKAEEESAGQALKRSEQILSNQREELRQLSKMYKDGDINKESEETEEIILTRQQDAVAAAEFALRMETLDHKRTLEVSLPREAKNLANSERSTAIILKNAQEEIPRSIEQGKLQLETQKITYVRAQADLADLEADRALFEFKAPTDGIFYHGAIENGCWTTQKLVDTLVPNGHPPTNTAFATFLPGKAKLELVSFLDDATARTLNLDLAATATLAGREDLEIPVKLTKLSIAPLPDGTYRANFSVTWPKEITPATGATAQIRLIAYQQAAAIVVPSKALEFEAAGWTVEVKLADGKTERRQVKRGRVSKDETEVLTGLEIGQVIVVP